MDNISPYFFAHTYLKKIPSAETHFSYDPGTLVHFPFHRTTVTLSETTLIHRQNASTVIPSDSLFLLLCVMLLSESEDSDMYKDRSPAAVYEDLVAALKAQIEKQDQIIRAQDETIRLLQEQNEEMVAFLDRYTKH